ncbi:MAG TPA: peptide deformylase [bacterium]|nr:peptide deformylase [bacterium]
MLKIITHPNPNLRKKSSPVESQQILTPEFQDLLNQMSYLMFKYDGAGLAAPQVNKQHRLVVINIKGQGQAFINPKIIKKSLLKKILEEGCLSIPGVFGYVKRPKKVTIKYQDKDAVWQEEKCDEYLSRVIQHEIDHLDGILFIDKMIKK